MKRIVSLILVCLILFTSAVGCFGATMDQRIYTNNCFVEDLTTGEELWSLNANDKMYPASLTKMMTALVAVEYLDEKKISYDEQIEADFEAANTEGSSFHIRSGESISWQDAINCMMLVSGNDLSVVIAKAIDGSCEEFAKRMNKKAEELELINTHFTNPHGLHEDDHYTCARDLAVIATALMQNEYLASVVGQGTYTYSATNMRAGATVNNTNQLFNGTAAMYAGNEKRTTKYENGTVLGVKTGTTDEAGNCLIAAAEKDGTKILVVILKSGTGAVERYADAHVLLDWAFANYKTVKLASKGDVVGEDVKVKKGEYNHVTAVVSEDIYITVPIEASLSTLDTSATLTDLVVAPISKGAILGTIEVLESGATVMYVDAIAKTDINEGGILSNFYIEDTRAAQIFKTIKTILLVILLLFVALICVRAYNKAQSRKRKALKAKRKAELEARKREEWSQQYDSEHDRE